MKLILVGFAMKVFGIGWSKTGTTTLGKCFEELGFSHQSIRYDLLEAYSQADMERIIEVTNDYQSFEDWPWPLTYQHLDPLFPGSKFILTERSARQWLRSYRNALSNEHGNSSEMRRYRQIIYGFDPRKVADDKLLERYNDHYRSARNYFEARPNDLLCVNWEAGDAWEKLCDFLSVSVPSTPFPHQNTGLYLQNRSMLKKLQHASKRLLRGQRD